MPTELAPGILSSATGGGDDQAVVSKGVQLFRERAKRVSDASLPPSTTTTNVIVEGKLIAPVLQ